MHLYECFADGWVLKGLRESVAGAPCLLFSAMVEPMNEAEVSAKIDAMSGKIDALSEKINSQCEMIYVLTELVKTHCVKKVGAQKTKKIPKPLTKLAIAKKNLTGALMVVVDKKTAEQIADIFFKDCKTKNGEEDAVIDISKVLLDDLKDEKTRDRLKTRYDGMTSTDKAKGHFNETVKRTKSNSHKSEKDARQDGSWDAWLGVLFSQLEVGCRKTALLGKPCTAGTPVPRGVGAPVTPMPKAAPRTPAAAPRTPAEGQRPAKRSRKSESSASASGHEASGAAAKTAAEEKTAEEAKEKPAEEAKETAATKRKYGVPSTSIFNKKLNPGRTG